jgi:lambda family phage portal protein
MRPRPNFLQRAGQGLAWAFAPQRKYDGAGRGMDRNARYLSVGSETLAAATRLRDRSRYYFANNAWWASSIRALQVGLVGAGIVPASMHSDTAVQKLLAAKWEEFSQVADADGRTDLPGIESQIVLHMTRDGEALAQMLNTADGLRVRTLPPEALDESKNADLGDGAHITGGVEFSSAGIRTAYWLFTELPSDVFAASIQSVRVPAEDILHVYESHGSGQVRGIPWGANALTRIGEIDQLENALLVGSKIAGLHAGFITDEMGTASFPFDGEQSGSEMTVSMEPGTVRRLGPGQKITFNSPQQSSQGVEFLASQLRAIASSFGVPAYLIDSDVSKANFSSLRAALVAYAARLEQVQYGVLIPQFMRPIYRRWITTEILRGAIDAPDFESRAEDWLGAQWFPPAATVADESKQAESDIKQIDAGLMSRKQAVAARGYSVDALDEERAADLAREKSLGVGAQSQKGESNP